MDKKIELIKESLRKVIKEELSALQNSQEKPVETTDIQIVDDIKGDLNSIIKNFQVDLTKTGQQTPMNENQDSDFDIVEFYETAPEDVKDILDKYIGTDDTDYPTLKDMRQELNQIGYDMDFDLGGNIISITAKNEVNEAGIMTTAGVLLAVPAILGLVSRIGKLAKDKFSKTFGKKPTSPDGMDAYLEKMSKVAEDLHHLYLVPVEKAVSLIVKDSNKAHKIANVVLHLIIAMFCLSAGITAVKALQTKNISLSMLESALSAIKGGELKEFLTKMLESI